jgi:hypothetical protein
MASIAEVWVEVLPSTAKIADGIKKALREVDDDVRAGRPSGGATTSTVNSASRRSKSPPTPARPSARSTSSSQTAIEHLSLPYDPATRRLFGVPVTTSNAPAAGVGHVLATGAVALDTDTRGVMFNGPRTRPPTRSGRTWFSLVASPGMPQVF